MADLQQLSDHHAIASVLTDYVHAIDMRDFEVLDGVFTAEAWIDYTAMGGIAARYPQMKSWLAEVLPGFPAYYHLLGLPRIRIDGDAATSQTPCFNPMCVELPGNGPQVMFLGLWYIDEWARTDQGWRITRRAEQKCFDHNVPDALKRTVQG